MQHVSSWKQLRSAARGPVSKDRLGIPPLCNERIRQAEQMGVVLTSDTNFALLSGSSNDSQPRAGYVEGLLQLPEEGTESVVRGGVKLCMLCACAVQ